MPDIGESERVCIGTGRSALGSESGWVDRTLMPEPGTMNACALRYRIGPGLFDLERLIGEIERSCQIPARVNACALERAVAHSDLNFGR